jgi:hypothetical protein
MYKKRFLRLVLAGVIFGMKLGPTWAAEVAGEEEKYPEDLGNRAVVPRHQAVAARPGDEGIQQDEEKKEAAAQPAQQQAARFSEDNLKGTFACLPPEERQLSVLHGAVVLEKGVLKDCMILAEGWWLRSLLILFRGKGRAMCNMKRQ